MNAIIEKYIEKENIKKEKIKEMTSNQNYIIWLKGITEEYSTIFDKQNTNNQSDLSKEDIEKINDLNILFEVIEKYACINHIEPLFSRFGMHYYISSNDINYEIGFTQESGTIFYCNRTNLDENVKTINFNDIINKESKKRHSKILKK